MSARTASSRASLLFVLFALLTGLSLFRLYETQVLEHADYAQAAERQSTGQVSEQAERGKIFATDRTGQLYPLAVSQWQYDLLVSPRQVKNKTALVDKLVGLFTELKANEVYDKINNDKVYVPALIKGITEEQKDQVIAQKLPGVSFEPHLARVYPEGAGLAAQALGFVGADGLGKYGLESIYNKQLTGKTGNQSVKKDSLGRLIDILGYSQPTSGVDLVLSLDYNIQFTVEKALKKALEDYQADSGTILVMEPKSGDVLALASQPTFDPNHYNEIPTDGQRVYLSQAASEPYEPGSIFKPITMASALDAGAINKDDVGTFGKSVTVNDRVIENAQGDAFGKETLGQILENSDNVAMVSIAEKMGSERQRDYFTKFGFGSPTNIDLVGEETGTLRDKKEWNDVLRSTSAFGQGISTNMFQLAAAYGAIANDGWLATPHLVKQYRRNGQLVSTESVAPKAVIKPEVAANLREMLIGVVERGHGKRAAVSGVKVAGKTGTAQVPDPKGGYYEDRHIGSFAGFLPADNPKVVMIVRLDNPKTVKFAESSAAPTFGVIANWLATYYGWR